MLMAMSDVTRILSQIEQGDPQAAEQLLPLVYEELRKLAAVRLASEKPQRGKDMYGSARNSKQLSQTNSVGHTCFETSGWR